MKNWKGHRRGRRVVLSQASVAQETSHLKAISDDLLIAYRNGEIKFKTMAKEMWRRSFGCRVRIRKLALGTLVSEALKIKPKYRGVRKQPLTTQDKTRIADFAIQLESMFPQLPKDGTAYVKNSPLRLFTFDLLKRQGLSQSKLPSSKTLSNWVRARKKELGIATARGRPRGKLPQDLA